MSQEETQKIRDTRIIAIYNDHNYSCSSRSSVDEQNKDRPANGGDGYVAGSGDGVWFSRVIGYRIDLD